MPSLAAIKLYVESHLFIEFSLLEGTTFTLTLKTDENMKIILEFKHWLCWIHVDIYRLSSHSIIFNCFNMISYHVYMLVKFYGIKKNKAIVNYNCTVIFPRKKLNMMEISWLEQVSRWTRFRESWCDKN